LYFYDVVLTVSLNIIHLLFFLPATTFATTMHCVPTQRTKALCKLSHYPISFHPCDGAAT